MKYSILRAFGRSRVAFSPAHEEPIRAELFSVERLEQHAESLAAAQHVTSRPKAGLPMAVRLYDNAKVLVEAYRVIMQLRHQPAVIVLSRQPLPTFDRSKYASAVGVAQEATVDGTGLWLKDKIVDDDAWRKVKEGVYKGFSIGGAVTGRDGGNPAIVTGVELTEISLVDRPANPDAVFALWKGDDAGASSPDGRGRSAADPFDPLSQRVLGAKCVCVFGSFWIGP